MSKLTAEVIINRGRNGETVTPYQIATIVNDMLDKAGLDPIRPQAMYNYDKNGLIVKGVKGIKEYTIDQALEFATKLVDRYIAKANKAQATETEVQEENTEVEGQMSIEDMIQA